MNREIKFRAWDESEGQMFLSPSDIRHLGSWFDAHLPGSLSVTDNIVIMQFINLKDKKGIDIYDGDILKDLKGKLYKVFRVNGGFAINIHSDDFYNENVAFYEPTSDQQTSVFISGNCEIIGNIPQNPELLNK